MMRRKNKKNSQRRATDKLSFYKFFKRFPDEESARDYFAERLWGKNEKDRSCPHCGRMRTVRAKQCYAL